MRCGFGATPQTDGDARVTVLFLRLRNRGLKNRMIPLSPNSTIAPAAISASQVPKRAIDPTCCMQLLKQRCPTEFSVDLPAARIKCLTHESYLYPIVSGFFYNDDTAKIRFIHKHIVTVIFIIATEPEICARGNALGDNLGRPFITWHTVRPFIKLLFITATAGKITLHQF